MDQPGINADLTLKSMILLGFNTDEYADKYTGISFVIPPLTPSSFERENEKALSVALHFLLSIADHEYFPMAVVKVWPYLDPGMKIEFSRVVQTSLDRLVHMELLSESSNDSLVLASACGNKVWQLLRELSDICLDLAIDYVQNEEAVSPVPSDKIDNLTPKAKKEEKKSEKLYEGDASSEDLLALLKTETNNIKFLVLQHIRRQERQNSYYEELDGRMKKAIKLIEVAGKKLEQTGQENALLFARTAGKPDRASRISKLEESKKLLKDLVASTLLVKSAQLLGEDRKSFEKGLISIPHSAKHRIHRENPHLKGEKGKEKLNLPSAMEESNHLTIEAVEACTKNLREAMDGMIDRIDEINDIF